MNKAKELLKELEIMINQKDEVIQKLLNKNKELLDKKKKWKKPSEFPPQWKIVSMKINGESRLVYQVINKWFYLETSEGIEAPGKWKYFPDNGE